MLSDVFLFSVSFSVVDRTAEASTLFPTPVCSSEEIIINSDVIIFSRLSSLLISSATFVALNG
jgi:hypothetical protein